jgi:hypothetical protein
VSINNRLPGGPIILLEDLIFWILRIQIPPLLKPLSRVALPPVIIFMDKYEKRNLIIKKTFAPGAGYARAGANTRARGARPLMGISPGPKGPGMKGNKFNWGRALPAPRRNLFQLAPGGEAPRWSRPAGRRSRPAGVSPGPKGPGVNGINSKNLFQLAPGGRSPPGVNFPGRRSRPGEVSPARALRARGEWK